MTVQDLGSLGELVASIATVATLGYLALQIRQNTRALEASAQRGFVQTWNDLALVSIENPAFADTYARGIADRGALSTGERIAFENYVLAILRSW